MFQASFQALKEASSVHKACPFRELAFNGRQVGAKAFTQCLPYNVISALEAGT